MFQKGRDFRLTIVGTHSIVAKGSYTERLEKLCPSREEPEVFWYHLGRAVDPTMATSKPMKNEAARIAALHNYAILDTEPEQTFDDLVLLACFISKRGSTCSGDSER